MNKENNIFENAIRKSLENHEAPYDASAWASLSAKLPKAATPFYKTNWFKGGVAMFLLATIATVALWDNNPKVERDLQLVDNTVSTNENTIETNVVINNTVSESKDNVVDEKVNDNITKNNIENSETKKTISSTGSKDVKGDEKPLKTMDESVSQTPGILITSQVINETENVSITKETPTADFTLAKEICQNSKIHLRANDFSEDASYSWKINDLDEIKVESISFELEKNGVNKITLFIKDSKGKVLAKTTKEIFVKSLPKNNVEIKMDKNSIKNKYNFELLDADNTIVWNFGDAKTSNEYLVTHTFDSKNIYKCNYTITNKDGCSVTHEKAIKVKGYYNIRTAYGFSPDNDGRNDNFIPAELKIINQPFEMTIQSRSGVFIYKTNSVDSPWNGNMIDGSKSSFGTYVWTVTLTNELGVKEVYQGTVTNVIN